MQKYLLTVLDAWIGRRATRSPAALTAVSGMTPAVVVTGGSRGIGLAIARRFASAGHAVVLVARDAEQLERAAGEIRKDLEAMVLPLALDITDAAAIDALEAGLASHGLYADVLVNNAGCGLSGAFETHGAGDLDRLIALDITALTRLMHHVLPQMRARGRGGVLNVASLGGYVPGPFQATYYASKAYVISLTEAVAAEMAGSGVRVCAVAPGPVSTGFHAAMGAEMARYRQLLPEMTPERVARSAYLGFMMGRTVIVPGLANTLTAYVLRVLPRPITVALVGWLLEPGPRKPETTLR